MLRKLGRLAAEQFTSSLRDTWRQVPKAIVSCLPWNL
jgi:hypothetical protein